MTFLSPWQSSWLKQLEGANTHWRLTAPEGSVSCDRERRGEEARSLEWKGEAATAHTAWTRRHTAPSRGRGQESHRRPSNSSSRFDCLPWQPYPQRTICWNTRSVRTSHIKLQHLSHAHEGHMASALTTEPHVRLFPPSLTFKRLGLGRSSKNFKAMHLVRTGDIVLT